MLLCLIVTLDLYEVRVYPEVLTGLIATFKLGFVPTEFDTLFKTITMLQAVIAIVAVIWLSITSV